MSTLLTSSIYGPLFAIGGLLLLLHFVSRACFMSHRARSKRLFSRTLWLPLRDQTGYLSQLKNEGESVEFSTKDGLTLRGSLFRRNSSVDRGTVLFFHELNGNRWSVIPYLENLLKEGFNVFTFDQRGHGESESSTKTHPAPWVTTSDLDDLTAAVEYLGKGQLGVFGLGKGATLALCCASQNSQVQAVVMDSPAPEDRLYEKNCLTAFEKLGCHFATHHFLKFIALSVKTLFYLVACPFFSLVSAWCRFMFRLWYGGNFVNTWAMIKKLRKPILILHDDLDSCVTLRQIRAFCRRMPVRPKICLSGFSTDQVASFFQQTLNSSEPLRVEQFNQNMSVVSKNSQSSFMLVR